MLIISELEVDDAACIHQMDRKIFPDSKYTLKQIENTIHPNMSYSIVVNDVLVGYVLAGFFRDESEAVRPYVYRDGVIFSIASLGILEEHRRKGYAKQLMEHLIRQVWERSQVKHILLQVEVGNPAFQLYQKLGFVKVADLPEYYSPTRDGYLMVLAAPSSPDSQSKKCPDAECKSN